MQRVVGKHEQRLMISNSEIITEIRGFEGSMLFNAHE